MNADQGPSHPRLALLVASGEVVDVPGDLAVEIIAAEPTVRRGWVKWSRSHHLGGRVILIDPDLVARIIERWPLPW